MKQPSLLLISLLFLVSTGFSQTVTIGKQVWTTKNLDVSTFRNGDAIPQAKTDEEWKRAADNEQAAWCFYGNDASNGTKYGKLYNWYAVNDARGLAPVGYHIPSEAEWTILLDYLGGEQVAGKKMKSKKGWGEVTKGTNSSGFSGLPGGSRDFSGWFEGSGRFYLGNWWSSTEYTKFKSIRCTVNWYDDDAKILIKSNSEGLSVRCIKD